jgi:hypothetical protein
MNKVKWKTKTMRRVEKTGKIALEVECDTGRVAKKPQAIRIRKVGGCSSVG